MRKKMTKTRMIMNNIMMKKKTITRAITNIIITIIIIMRKTIRTKVIKKYIKRNNRTKMITKNIMKRKNDAPPSSLMDSVAGPKVKIMEGG
jgi:hypothetical protein